MIDLKAAGQPSYKYSNVAERLSVSGINSRLSPRWIDFCSPVVEGVSTKFGMTMSPCQKEKSCCQPEVPRTVVRSNFSLIPRHFGVVNWARHDKGASAYVIFNLCITNGSRDRSYG